MKKETDMENQIKIFWYIDDFLRMNFIQQKQNLHVMEEKCATFFGQSKL